MVKVLLVAMTVLMMITVVMVMKEKPVTLMSLLMMEVKAYWRWPVLLSWAGEIVIDIQPGIVTDGSIDGLLMQKNVLLTLLLLIWWRSDDNYY